MKNSYYDCSLMNDECTQGLPLRSDNTTFSISVASEFFLLTIGYVDSLWLRITMCKRQGKQSQDGKNNYKMTQYI